MAEQIMRNSPELTEVLQSAVALCAQLRQQFVTPEHFLYELLSVPNFDIALKCYDSEASEFKKRLLNVINRQEKVPEGTQYAPQLSEQSRLLMQNAASQAYYSGHDTVDITHFSEAMLHLEDSWANYLLLKEIDGDAVGFMHELIEVYDFDNYSNALDVYNPAADDNNETTRKTESQWKSLVTCVNDDVINHNPLIGREEELERTIQVLCRKGKNNPLHVGEPGVGKTALVYGLVDRINKGEVPERLKNCKIYAMDMGTMLAGTQYRGDFEKRIKQVMEGVRKEGNVIIYIDEIHNLIGAGRGSDGSLDASNMLKPYLESGDIRFIGSTTYEEYKRYFAKSKGIVRRFQEIDIQEPSIDDTIKILKGLQKKYEDFHHVKYTDEAIDYAVRASAKYISDRFLPDKAIDLIDEAGAYRELQALLSKGAGGRLLLTNL